MVFEPLQHANMSKSECAAAFKSNTDSCARTPRLRGGIAGGTRGSVLRSGGHRQQEDQEK
jgi:hypothetical protein